MSRAEWSCGLCAVLATALTIVPAIVLAIVPAIVLAVVPATVLAIVLAHVLALVLATVLAIVLASLLAIVLASVLTIVLALVHRTRFVSVLENRCVVKQGPQSPRFPFSRSDSEISIFRHFMGRYEGHNVSRYFKMGSGSGGDPTLRVERLDPP